MHKDRDEIPTGSQYRPVIPLPGPPEPYINDPTPIWQEGQSGYPSMSQPSQQRTASVNLPMPPFQQLPSTYHQGQQGHMYPTLNVGLSMSQNHSQTPIYDSRRSPAQIEESSMPSRTSSAPHATSLQHEQVPQTQPTRPNVVLGPALSHPTRQAALPPNRDDSDDYPSESPETSDDREFMDVDSDPEWLTQPGRPSRMTEYVPGTRTLPVTSATTRTYSGVVRGPPGQIEGGSSSLWGFGRSTRSTTPKLCVVSKTHFRPHNLWMPKLR